MPRPEEANYKHSGATTSQRGWGTGEGVVNHGAVSGYYIFRRVRPSAA